MNNNFDNNYQVVSTPISGSWCATLDVYFPVAPAGSLVSNSNLQFAKYTTADLQNFAEVGA